MILVKVNILIGKVWGVASSSDFKVLKGDADAAGPGTTLD